jgi:hypothetical protein
VLVHSKTHGMALIRYVHNNPVRAGLVERASESGWSSHRVPSVKLLDMAGPGAAGTGKPSFSGEALASRFQFGRVGQATRD